MSNKKPDNVADNPNILPYGSNVGAPSIIVDNVDSWKQTRVNKVNKQFQSKFDELRLEYQKLVDEYNWNDLVYQSKFSFEPVINEIYHLYYGNDDMVFLSLINPNEWNKQYIGSFKYNHDNKWIKTEWNF
jgi:hypothetical protein